MKRGHGYATHSTITYSVTVDNPDTGGKVLSNAAASADPGSTCPAGSTGSPCGVAVPVIGGALTITALASSRAPSGCDHLSLRVVCWIRLALFWRGRSPVRLSWHPRNAQASVVMLGGLIAMPIAVLPGHVAPTKPVTATAGAGVPKGASHMPPGSVPSLTIGVSDGRTAVKAGDQLTYVVSVRDGGTRSAPHLKITQTLSAGLEFLSASPHSTAANGQVAWYAGIPAGRTQTFRVVARVTRPPAQLLRLAAVACAAADGTSSRPIVCAAHLDRLPAAAAAPASQGARPAGRVLLAYAVAALVVLAAGVLAVIAFRRLRLRRRPA
jgi:uncharacterized repeat protein (TIGR01451 family)